MWLGVTSQTLAAEKPLIAVITANSQPRHQDIQAVFAEYSQAFCGSQCRIFEQAPGSDMTALRNSIRRAVALGADLLVTYGPAAALAAKAESPSIPTLFADVYDPVRLELVSAKTLTGHNMTGIRGDAPLQALFKYFTDATGARKLVIVYDQTSLEGNLQRAALEDSGRKRGVAVIPLAMATDNHMSALQELPDDTDGLFLAINDPGDEKFAEVLKIAAQRRLPVISQCAGSAEMGAFMALETGVEEQGRRLAEIVGQVLAGTKADEIPLYKPRQIAFVVNLKVAREYGIPVPMQTLSLATRIVR